MSDSFSWAATPMKGHMRLRLAKDQGRACLTETSVTRARTNVALSVDRRRNIREVIEERKNFDDFKKWRNSMKAITLAFTALLLVGVSSYAAPRSASRTFSGEIMDSACANMGNHDGGYKMSNTHTPKDCTLDCVKAGSKFVLYNSASKTVYQLDDQQKPRDFAGQKVKVVGTYDTGTKTIHVEKIEAGS
jgi:hypothetical protein